MKIQVSQIMHHDRAVKTLAQFVYAEIEKRRTNGPLAPADAEALQSVQAAITTVENMAQALTGAEVSIKG